MAISNKLKSYFSYDVRERGAMYHEQKRVSYRLVGNFAAHAQVRGNEAYQCSIYVDQDKKSGKVTLNMECACPYFENGNSCKHLWALILTLDNDPWTQTIDNARTLIVENLHDEDEEDDDYDNDEIEGEEDDEDDEITSLLQKSQQIAKDRVKGKARVKGESPNSIPWDSFKQRVLPYQNIARLSLKDEEEQGKARSLFFVLDLNAGLEGGDLALRFFYREHLQGGKLGVFKALTLLSELKREFTDPLDRELFKYLLKECDGFKEGFSSSYYRSRSLLLTTKREPMNGFLLPPSHALSLLLRLAEKGKLFYIEENSKRANPSPLLVSNETWHFEATILEHDDDHFRLGGLMVNSGRTQTVESFRFLADGRYAIEKSVFFPSSLNERKHEDWLTQLTLDLPVTFLRKDFDSFVEEYARFPYAPSIRWPEGMDWYEETLTPRPRLRLSHHYYASEEKLVAEIIFQYPQENVNALNAVPSWVDQNTKRIALRDLSAERAFIATITALEEIHPIYDPDLREEGKTVFIHLKDISGVVAMLEEQGWDIDIQGKKVTVLKDFDIVAQGETDWFDLEITTKIDSKTYQVPELLRKQADGEFFIPLGTQEYALLPEAWLERLAVLKKSGQVEDQRFRFPSRQALILDSLLSELKIDNQSERLRAVRDKIRNFKSLEAVEAPEGFKGTLRQYQKEGLAWLEFLQDFGFGGCLSDEMGLGKTIQVLAMLLRYHTKQQYKPSLIVVPRSLVSNWISEAEKFCPALRIMDLSGSSRDWTILAQEQPDLVITTYGLLRQDIAVISKLSFAYAILDESQVIKNQSSLAAKATLLIKSQHRLAMSGTPIENHMRELMSLMNFLNPGLLDSPHWKEVFSKRFDAQDPFIKNLVTAIRPLMLRRTKALVLKDLPAKVEDVLYCELEGEQKLHYEQLKTHYQINLLPKLQDANWKKSSIVLIEALLRMRQAACHSGLVDKAYSHVPSSKLETLFDKLQEIRESGHKALIFSQFTSFLKIVSAQFSQEGIPFEYLDASTRDRAARVNRFQNDPSVPFFLISLKAGGVGLNLTAADYCFILDPWWNPAAEAQAIDRAHRINQKNTVFAYRIIAKGTVEEKIQALQKNKREMVESILDGEGSLINDLDLKSIQSLFA
jgi:hypothetical protein